MTIAEERIEELARLAKAAIEECEGERSRRFVRRARRIAERNRIPLPRRFERFTCDTCDVYLRPGVNARVRLQEGHAVVTCDCGNHARYPYR